MKFLENLQVIVALGKIAFVNSLRMLRQQGYSVERRSFVHAGVFKIGDRLPWMVTSYHPSRQNTQTGRLTSKMFDEIWDCVKDLLAQPSF